MSLRSDKELANTEAKLRILEECYEEAESDREGTEYARQVELGSLRRRVNRFKEEIFRYKAGCSERNASSRGLSNDQELLNTKRKLRLLEVSLKRTREKADDDPELRDLEVLSLKRMINQFKEEIARYEARQPAQR